MSGVAICERLRARAAYEGKRQVGRTNNARAMSEAADIIEALYGALKALRGNIGCASLVRNPVGIKLRADADAALSRARNGGQP